MPGTLSDDDLDRRLRAARPEAADVEPTAFDAELLSRVTRAPERRRRVALPIAAVAAAALAVAVVLAGTHLSATDDAQAAIARAARWFAPAPGTILHTRSVLSDARSTLVQEAWQAVDAPGRQRLVQIQDGRRVETTADAVYDPTTRTIYENAKADAADLTRERRRIRTAIERKIAGAQAAGVAADVIARLRHDERRLVAEAGTRGAAGGAATAGDTTVAQIRKNLEAGRATAGAATTHDGVEAYPITLLQPGAGGRSVRWTLWTAARDGRPLELRIDSGPGTAAVETTRWTAYELLPAGRAAALLTLTGAHPGATVVRDRTAYEAATRRLFPNG
jgi:hypothetical protein